MSPSLTAHGNGITQPHRPVDRPQRNQHTGDHQTMIAHAIRAAINQASAITPKQIPIMVDAKP